MFKVIFDMVVWQLQYLVDGYFQLTVSFHFVSLTFLLEYGWDCQGTTLSPSLYLQKIQ